MAATAEYILPLDPFGKYCKFLVPETTEMMGP
jgi:hypothetical protein